MFRCCAFKSAAPPVSMEVLMLRAEIWKLPMEATTRDDANCNSRNSPRLPEACGSTGALSRITNAQNEPTAKSDVVTGRAWIYGRAEAADMLAANHMNRPIRSPWPCVLVLFVATVATGDASAQVP